MGPLLKNSAQEGMVEPQPKEVGDEPLAAHRGDQNQAHESSEFLAVCNIP